MDHAFNIFRGESIPLQAILDYNPRYRTRNAWKRWLWTQFMLSNLRRNFYAFSPMYNLPAARLAKEYTGIPIISVGGFRRGSQIRHAVEEQGIEDFRWPVAQVTSQAAIANLPFGSGFGTFVPVFEQFAPRTLLLDQNRYVNHAHNDWLELWLTGGVIAIVLTVGFLAWLAASTFSLWRRGEPEARVLDLALAQAASIWSAFLTKAQFGAQMAYELAQKYTKPDGAALSTPSSALSPALDTLRPEDLEPAWRGKNSRRGA